MNDRIARITDSKLTLADLWPNVHGPMATRESRMEVVAWIAVCKFHCTLEGGFVRDWIVANDRARPQSSDSPLQWLRFNDTDGTPSLNKTLVPYDLDCILPLDRHFDVERFRDEINEFHIETKLFRSHVHYKLLLDENAPTGPFTMDLVEPYSTARFTIPDLDVNSLYVKRDQSIGIIEYTDLTDPAFSIDLKQIIENIQRKQFKVLVLTDKNLAKCITKMIARGWSQKGELLTHVPNKMKFKLDAMPLAPATALYMKINNEMNQIPGFAMVSIEEIYNPNVEITYESMKELIASQCPGNNPNERFLFHGTHRDKAQKIIEEGFDYGIFRTQGLFGDGAYFADNPCQSHQYTLSNNNSNMHIMFYNKVVLGLEMVMNNVNKTLCSAPRDYHSIRGCISQFPEYVVYRFTQILPVLKITYRTCNEIKEGAVLSS